jgi:hypothetical protein
MHTKGGSKVQQIWSKKSNKTWKKEDPIDFLTTRYTPLKRIWLKSPKTLWISNFCASMPSKCEIIFLSKKTMFYVEKSYFQKPTIGLWKVPLSILNTSPMEERLRGTEIFKTFYSEWKIFGRILLSKKVATISLPKSL